MFQKNHVSGLRSISTSRAAAVSQSAAIIVLGFIIAQSIATAAGKKSWRETKSPMLQSDFPVTTTSVGYALDKQPVARTKGGKPVLDETGKPVMDSKTQSTANAPKALAIILQHDAFACFDTDLLRMASGWTGNYISTRGVTFDGAHGGHPEIIGEEQFTTPKFPGWARASSGKAATDPFAAMDERTEPFGPARTIGRYDGMYVVGMDVVLAYTVLGTKVYEQPGSVESSGKVGFTRTFQTDKARESTQMLVCEVKDGRARLDAGQVVVESASGTTFVSLVGAPKGVTLEIPQAQAGRVVLNIAKGAGGLFKLVIFKGNPDDKAAFAAMSGGKPQMVDFKKGGPAHWPEPVVTKGELATSTTPDGAYTVDKLTPPVDNPWKRRIRFGGMDFFSDGKRAALSTWDGDVWIVSGIDDKLEHLTWRRFASGGFDLLGLKIVNEVIYTVGRNQITRYHDLNNDGEADYYESFNNDYTASQGFHEFCFDLQTDTAGNFYFAKAGPVRGGGRGFGGGGGNGEITANAGTLMKVAKDGSKLEVIATGVRAPNGIGISPEGQLTTGDNEGTWVPACPINWVHPGSFHGVETLAHKSPIPEFAKPLCWLSKSWDNSGGGQAWVTSDKWGPFQGEMLHTSYGQSALYLVLKDKVGNQMQGGVVRIPVKFTSSAMRPRFNPRDGQLYVAGLRGWQSNAANETGFDRVRYTGKPIYMVEKLHVDAAGVHLSFTQPLDPKDVDAGAFAVEQWNYHRTEDYGSPEFSVADPNKHGHDKVPVAEAKLSSDGKTVTLKIPGLKPVNQMLIKFNVLAKDGTELKQEVMLTIHEVPGQQSAGAN